MTAQITAAAQKIVAEIAPLVKEKFNIEVPRITYRASTRMTRCWGNARVENVSIPTRRVYEMKLSANVFNETNLDSESFRNTVIHELAHLLEVALHGRMSDHGFDWREIMRKLNTIPNRRVTGAERKEIGHVPAPKRLMTKYVHKCTSQTCTAVHKVGGQVHNKIMLGCTYTCRRCGTKLVQDYTTVKA